MMKKKGYVKPRVGVVALENVLFSNGVTASIESGNSLRDLDIESPIEDYEER